MNSFSRAATALSTFCLVLGLLPGCRDDDPCDEGQESTGTGCFPRSSGGSGGLSAAPAGGASGEGGAAPSGNPDATFGTACESDADCGSEAPVCDDQQFHYCLQVECQEGEANEGACPTDWTCFKYQDNPSACIKL
ncbi:MAG: hypothetical protein EOO73_04065 [Myxococcales bacterium]|nr:MAG: hypothetical protein EOO73_04065 [Myxococcales bacterium]